jgi:hypothetical protein
MRRKEEKNGEPLNYNGGKRYPILLKNQLLWKATWAFGNEFTNYLLEIALHHVKLIARI